MLYITKMPAFVKFFYPSQTWKIDTQEKIIYLTFDDGPHPLITPMVLDILKTHNAKATFFCIGKNVVKNPNTYRSILEAGHSVGNHTQHHLNGAKTDDETYLDDIAEAKKYIGSPLFRPPYGRISRFQQKQLDAPRFQLRTIMWSVLSADFDPAVSPQKCLANVTLQASAGDIVVFHDSEKAADKMLFALPRTLEFFSEKNYRFDAITPGLISKS